MIISVCRGERSIDRSVPVIRRGSARDTVKSVHRFIWCSSTAAERRRRRQVPESNRAGAENADVMSGYAGFTIWRRLCLWHFF